MKKIEIPDKLKPFFIEEEFSYMKDRFSPAVNDLKKKIKRDSFNIELSGYSDDGDSFKMYNVKINIDEEANLMIMKSKDMVLRIPIEILLLTENLSIKDVYYTKGDRTEQFREYFREIKGLEPNDQIIKFNPEAFNENSLKKYDRVVFIHNSEFFGLYDIGQVTDESISIKNMSSGQCYVRTPLQLLTSECYPYNSGILVDSNEGIALPTLVDLKVYTWDDPNFEKYKEEHVNESNNG